LISTSLISTDLKVQWVLSVLPEMLDRLVLLDFKDFRVLQVLPEMSVLKEFKVFRDPTIML